jgi:hypothetical protein
VAPDFLADIRRCADGRNDFDELLVAAIKGARRQGISWTQIGEAVGMTRQGAAQRYAKFCPKPQVEDAS